MLLDVSVAGAALAGLLSFLSPCILPIVPFYLSYMAGVSMNQITADGGLTREVRIGGAVGDVLCAGVITIFMGLGAAASSFGQLVRDWFGVLRWVAAAIIIVMGLHFLGVIRIGFLYRQFRAEARQHQQHDPAGRLCDRACLCALAGRPASGRCWRRS